MKTLLLVYVVAVLAACTCDTRYLSHEAPDATVDDSGAPAICADDAGVEP